MTDMAFVKFHTSAIASLESLLKTSYLTPLERYDFNSYLRFHKDLLGFFNCMKKQPSTSDVSFIASNVFSQKDRGAFLFPFSSLGSLVTPGASVSPSSKNDF